MVFIHGAGAGKGSFNYRFAQTTRHPSHYEGHLYPADFFPFATTRERDPVTGEEGSLLDRARALGAVPLCVHTATATEYWTRAASLLHSDVTGARDVPLDPDARLYVIAGAQHGVSAAAGRGCYELCGNPLDYRPLLRALLSALVAWATPGGWANRGTPPPESVYPKLADATLGDVAGYRAGFPSPPGLRLPKTNLPPPEAIRAPRSWSATRREAAFSNGPGPPPKTSSGAGFSWPETKGRSSAAPGRFTTRSWTRARRETAPSGRRDLSYRGACFYGIWSDLRNSESSSDWDEMFNLA